MHSDQLVQWRKIRIKKDICFTGFAAADRCTVFLKDIGAQSINFPWLSVSHM